MLKLLLLAFIQNLFLCAGLVMVKMVFKTFKKVTFSWDFFVSLMTNKWWIGAGVTMSIAGLMWIYIFKNYPFSKVYPLSSMAYVMGMIAAIFVFHEHVSWIQWIGIVLIMLGCFCVVN